SYVLPSGRGGVQVSWSAYGRQYRNTANTQVIRSHSIVDARLWHALTASSRVSVEANNLTRSDKGEKAYTWRTGRYVGVTLETQF
ncbi:hypothetical protein RZS08_61480, partial [Arthrospira platensis SPKY1]|nr:hypothetical protein [Arthrospira platensis SPKY1]